MTAAPPFLSVYPYTGETVASYVASSPAETEAALQRLARRNARPLPVHERAALLRRLAEAFSEPTNAERLARLVTRETGKLIREARSETAKCAEAFAYFAETAEAWQAPERIPLAGGAFALTERRPLGTVLAVLPWNFPLWQAARVLAPALQAGNTMLLKHAPSVQGCAEALAALAREAAGDDASPLEAVRLFPAETLALIEDPRVAAVTLTGGEQAGRAVGAAAGRALKPSALELGGSDPYVVLSDADPDLAARACAEARLVNAGQSCIAAKRIIVARECYEPFMERFTAHLAEALPGDPEREETGLAPLAGGALAAARADAFVQDALSKGAKLRLRPAREAGSPFFPAACLEDCGPGMCAFDEETFFPLAAVAKAEDEAHALCLANAGRYGLGGAVFSNDHERALRFSLGLRGGGCALNRAFRSDPRVPFGGVGLSGYGRELGRAGADAFVCFRTIYE